MIRSLQQKDFDSVMEIWLQSTKIAHPFIEATYWDHNFNLVKTTYLPHSTTYVYESDSEVQGFISIIDDSFIGALFIHPKHQGNGIGSLLLQQAIYHYPQLSLAVYKDNVSAIEFYKSKGFQIIEKQLNEDSMHEEYVMRYE